MSKKVLLIAISILLLIATIYYLTKVKDSNNVTIADNVIKIGILTPLTGENASYGQATMKGVELALEEIKSNPDFSNVKFEIIKEDTRLEANKAVSGIQKLITVDKVNVILGPFGSSEVLAVSKIANESKTPIISASATADAIANAGEYVFRIVPSNKEQGSSMAEFVVSKLNIKDSIAILALNNDYGNSLSSSFKNKIESLGGRIIFEDKFNEKTTDFRTVIVKLKSLNPNFIYLPDHYNEAGLFLKQAKELGLACKMGGGDGSYSPDLITIAGKASEGFYLTMMGMNDDQKYKNFELKYKTKYREDVDVYSAYAYDAIYVIANAIKTNKHSNSTQANFVNSLLNQQYIGISGNNSFDSIGEVSKPFKLNEVLNSKIVKTID